jgi:hypothetical protein
LAKGLKFFVYHEFKLSEWKEYSFCVGLFPGTAICMKWMEAGFFPGSQKFTIPGLEIFIQKKE